jgi:uncharacterized protein (UPF0261 family)
MRALPVGVPKLMISTVASSDVRRYVGPSDMFMLHSVADIQGLNSMTRAVLSNAAHAMAGMVKARAEATKAGPASRASRNCRHRPDHVRRDHAVHPADHRSA